MTPEGRIKSMMTKRLKIIQARYPGMLAYRMPVLRGMGKPLLDYIVCANGQWIMIETKRSAKHDLTAQQKATMREFEAAGARVWRVYDEVTADGASKDIVSCLK